jgi:hypothetical protein
MVISHLLADVHWTPVFVMTLFSFAIGYAWHQPWMFGDLWKRENYTSGMPEKVNAPVLFGGTAVLHFMANMGLSAVVSGEGVFYGLSVGFLASVFWILPAMGGTYLFANRSLKLLAVDAGMYVVMFSISGLVLGIW